MYILLFTVLDVNDDTMIMWFFASLTATIFGFKAWVERKYLEGTKHVATFIVMIVSVITFLGIMDVLEQGKYTSFEEAIMNNIVLSEVEAVSILRHSDNVSVSLRDGGQIEQLFRDFQEVELKEADRYLIETSRFMEMISRRNMVCLPYTCMIGITWKLESLNQTDTDIMAIL
ncbi:hypothetical protein ACERII_17025 [Evansella sp. AB-rgal1]|uniref:hypothetical protein n=1 Tax=Evansella sp. AB-rgal1 TaxID=3242696 RepID=UPI00359D8A0A